MIFIKNYINKKNSLQNTEIIHNDWNINIAFILDLPMIPQDKINFLRRKYSSGLYLYNFYMNTKDMNTKDINTKSINILNYNTVYYQYTPQILDNILYNNHYISAYLYELYILPLYHHLVLVKYINATDKYIIKYNPIRFTVYKPMYDENNYYLGIFYNHHLYVSNICWDTNKQLQNNNEDKNNYKLYYDLILDQLYINTQIEKLDTFIQAHQLLNKL